MQADEVEYHLMRKFSALTIASIILGIACIFLTQQVIAHQRDLPFTWERPARPTLSPKPRYTIRTKTSMPIQPTNTPTPTKTPTLTFIQKPTATPTPQPTATPIQTSSAPTNDQQAFMMQAINEYRKSKGLSEVKTDSYTCSFAKIRAQEIASNFSHDGFTNRINNKTLPYPSYSLVTENIAMTSDYKRVVQMWINSAGHAANMQKDTPYVCVESYGNYYAYLGWKP